jgi:hypothetical protein
MDLIFILFDKFSLLVFVTFMDGGLKENGIDNGKDGIC